MILGSRLVISGKYLRPKVSFLMRSISSVGDAVGDHDGLNDGTKEMLGPTDGLIDDDGYDDKLG